MKNATSLESLIRALSGLPGLGPRSARRMALHLLTRKDQIMLPLADLIRQTAEDIVTCHICGNLDATDPCAICTDHGRDPHILCIVAHVADLWALERTRAFKGRYHVLGGVLSALDGVGPEDLTLPKLQERLQDEALEEIILALPATVDGQSTAHYIADLINDTAASLTITRLAHGVPVGGELDYLDDNTIATALRARTGS